MNAYYYFPVLKTRQSEMKAYELLDDSIKDAILPIIEMTGAIGYTYPKNYKIEELRHSHRAGDIFKKIDKILSWVGSRKFILDITDDESLMYDGLSPSAGGLLSHVDGYKNWISFLTSNELFRKQVIPTIQFYSSYVTDLSSQIKKLDKNFEFLAIKLPAINGKNQIESIINWVLDKFDISRLILILDFDYVKTYEPTKQLISQSYTNPAVLSRLKAIISVSSSFPNYVNNVEKPIPIYEYKIYNELKNSLGTRNVYMGDFASLHPKKYEMGGGGWIPRIDYVERDEKGCPILFDYERGNARNTSSEYNELAARVAKKYKPISEIQVKGDLAIKESALGGVEGKSPAYWIAMRANMYMTAQVLFLKDNVSPLVL